MPSNDLLPSAIQLQDQGNCPHCQRPLLGFAGNTCSACGHSLENDWASIPGFASRLQAMAPGWTPQEIETWAFPLPAFLAWALLEGAFLRTALSPRSSGVAGPASGQARRAEEGLWPSTMYGECSNSASSPLETSSPGPPSGSKALDQCSTPTQPRALPWGPRHRGTSRNSGFFDSPVPRSPRPSPPARSVARTSICEIEPAPIVGAPRPLLSAPGSWKIYETLRQTSDDLAHSPVAPSARGFRLSPHS